MTNPRYIARDMQPALRSALATFPAVTICGPRQSGKTTMCRKEFPELPYVNLEDLTSRTFAAEDPAGFLAQYADGAIIDEAQLVPSLFSQIQVLVDNDRFAGNSNRKYILTGSRNFAMMPELRQSLAGRTAVFTLLPLSTAEICRAGFSDRTPEQMIASGGYPAVWTSPESSRRLILESYIDTYVERDVRRLMDVKDLRKFATFLRLCAARIGSELNKSSLAVEVGVTVPTIDSWLSVLEASFVVSLLQPWHANIGKRLTKSPKLYFCDTGVACTLLGITAPAQLEGHPLRGALFENLVVNNMMKHGLNQGLKEQLFFYRDKTGREIDLLHETATGIRAFEIKAGMTYHPDYMRHIAYLKDLLGDRLEASAVVYTGDTELPSRQGAVVNYRNFPENCLRK